MCGASYPASSTIRMFGSPSCRCPVAISRSIVLTTRTLAYRARGRYDEAKAREVLAALRRLFGKGTTWWTNIDQTAWTR